MTRQAINALHDVHTSTNDVLKGYREMAARAEPEIQTVIRRLCELHQRHAAEQEAELLRLRGADGGAGAGQDDSSVQGTVNQVVVMLRDWLSNLDRDVLPAVRSGEEALQDEYKKAMQKMQVQEDSAVVALLQTQCDSIAREIALLPKG